MTLHIDPESVERSHARARATLGHDLTYTEKILWTHLADPLQTAPVRGKDPVLLRPDRIAMQDATATMAVLQFLQAKGEKVAIPTTIHCDHLIMAKDGVRPDMSAAHEEFGEVFDFLRSASNLGIGFWEPNSGIIHQIVLERYAVPGGLMIGTDSHTPNAGGLGMMAPGVGGADAVDVMLGAPWEVVYPRIIGVRLTGRLGEWTEGKDIILRVLEMLTVRGGTNAVIEYFGPGVESLSCTEQATVTNMGAEAGATCSVFPYHDAMGAYLRSTGRADIADACDRRRAQLRPDPAVEADPERFYDRVLEIDLDTLEPYLSGPRTPDRARPLSVFIEEVRRGEFPYVPSAVHIGSCTNSSYEDLGRAADIARQARELGMTVRTNFFVSPGSRRVYDTAERDGLIAHLLAVGATILANACGPCIGNWNRKDILPGTPNIIATSFNRNFDKRNDNSPFTGNIIGGPVLMMAFALAGRLDFDPRTDPLVAPDGRRLYLRPPVAQTLPPEGFILDDTGFVPPADGGSAAIHVDPASQRLQLLEPFPAPAPGDIVDAALLVRVADKCTTDHISPAGSRWLPFRGHLNNLSDNLLAGAVNAATRETGMTKNLFTGDYEPYPQVARAYKAAALPWVIVGEENYGEGSSREHAAMSPRLLGAVAVIVKSFARIHETNLKRQGVLALTFIDPADYDRVREGDRVSILGLDGFAEGTNLTIGLRHTDGTTESFEVKHSFTQKQIAWYRAGSAAAARAALAIVS